MTDEQLIKALADFRAGTLSDGNDLWWTLQDLADEVDKVLGDTIVIPS